MIDYMLKYIDEHYGKRPGFNEGERHELEYLRKAVPALRSQVLGDAPKSPGESTGESEAKNEISSEDSYGEEEEGVDALPAGPLPRKTGPRMSVSAEVFGNFNKQAEFKPVVHPKSEAQIQAIKSRIKGNFMFDALNPKDTKAIIDAIVPTKKKDADVIIRQGEDGDNFYVVESGALACTKKFEPEGEDTFLKEYKPGESFGELALLYNAPRAATIIAKGDVELWSLDRNTFTHILKTAMQKKREKYDNFLDQVEILKTLEK